MSREKTWKQAKDRLRTFARAENPEQLSVIQNPDDAETMVAHSENANSLVAVDNPDDQHVHQPETLGIKQKQKANRIRM